MHVKHPTTPQTNEVALLVSGISLEGLALARSPFRPRTASRSADRGTIEGSAVRDVHLVTESQTVHLVEDQGLLRSLRLGDWITVSVDEEHRARLDRLDTLGHLLWFAIAATCSNVNLISRTIGPQHATVEVDAQTPTDTSASVIQRWVEAVVRDDILINRISRGTGGRTYWQVDGVGCVPCEARHPLSTGVVGTIDVTATQLSPSRVRLIAQ